MKAVWGWARAGAQSGLQLGSLLPASHAALQPSSPPPSLGPLGQEGRQLGFPQGLVLLNLGEWCFCQGRPSRGRGGPGGSKAGCILGRKGVCVHPRSRCVYPGDCTTASGYDASSGWQLGSPATSAGCVPPTPYLVARPWPLPAPPFLTMFSQWGVEGRKEMGKERAAPSLPFTLMLSPHLVVVRCHRPPPVCVCLATLSRCHPCM